MEEQDTNLAFYKYLILEIAGTYRKVFFEVHHVEIG